MIRIHDPRSCDVTDDALGHTLFPPPIFLPYSSYAICGAVYGPNSSRFQARTMRMAPTASPGRVPPGTCSLDPPKGPGFPPQSQFM